MNLGISIYSGQDEKLTARMIRNARKAGIRTVFLSLQEDDNNNITDDVTKVLNLCRKYNLDVFMDINHATLKKLGLNQVRDVHSLGLRTLRLDKGFSVQEQAELTHDFQIIINAATLSDNVISSLKQYGADFANLTGCHNFYPEIWTGMSYAKVKDMNTKLHALGIRTMGFVPGNGELRGPMFEGLPTIEEQRSHKEKMIENMLEMHEAGTDVVLVGDPEIKNGTWKDITLLAQNQIRVKVRNCQLPDEYMDTVHHDRSDESDYLFRSSESRAFKTGSIEAGESAPRPAGTICIANDKFDRYKGELTITKKELPEDERVNVVGSISEDDLHKLHLIDGTFGVVFWK